MLWQRNITALKPAGYIGQPAQRYLKIAWGYGKDVPAQLALELGHERGLVCEHPGLCCPIRFVIRRRERDRGG